VAHPEHGHGERRAQLVQLVDLYPTVLAAIGRECPPDRHGVNLLPVLEDAATPTRDFALSGYFGGSVSVTDGRWSLHQSPAAGNQPLHWYSPHLAKFQVGLDYRLGPYRDGRRPARATPHPTPTWLSDRRADPTELVNLAALEPAELDRMQRLLVRVLRGLDAPAEHVERLGLQGLG
jgi:arylsulfatase A-like enzyme